MDNLQVSGVTINSLESPRGTSSEPLKSSLGFRIWKMSEKLLKSIPRTGHCVTLAVGMGHGKLLANNYVSQLLQGLVLLYRGLAT